MLEEIEEQNKVELASKAVLSVQLVLKVPHIVTFAPEPVQQKVKKKRSRHHRETDPQKNVVFTSDSEGVKTG